MNSTSDFQNLYRALSHSAARSLMPRRWRLRIGAICTAIFICGYSAMAQLIAAGRCARQTVFCWLGAITAFAKSFCRAGFGHRSGAFSTKLKQAESAGRPYRSRVVLFDYRQDWLKNTPDARAVSLSEWQAPAFRTADPPAGPG